MVSPMKSQSPPRKAPAKTILLVDDDAAVREMIGRVLLAELGERLTGRTTDLHYIKSDQRQI